MPLKARANQAFRAKKRFCDNWNRGEPPTLLERLPVVVVVIVSVFGTGTSEMLKWIGCIRLRLEGSELGRGVNLDPA